MVMMIDVLIMALIMRMKVTPPIQHVVFVAVAPYYGLSPIHRHHQHLLQHPHYSIHHCSHQYRHSHQLNINRSR